MPKKLLLKYVLTDWRLLGLKVGDVVLEIMWDHRTPSTNKNDKGVPTYRVQQS